MRILFLGVDVFAKGGIPRYSIYQIKALINIHGAENVFVFSLAPYNPNSAFEEKIKTEYVQGKVTFLSKLIFTFKALKLIKVKKIELVICNHIQLSIISWFAKQLYGTKYVTNVYGIEVWTNVKARDILGLRNSDIIIGDCNFVLDYIKKHFKIKKPKFRLLHGPVDTNKFKPMRKDQRLFKKYTIPDNKFIAMTVGRLERNKGFELVIKSLSELPEDIIYVIVGDGSKKNEFKDLAVQLKLSERVFFTLRVPEQDLVGLYNLCDVFVLVSEFGHGEGEGLPLGLIEASACAKPIIGGNADGSVDAIENGKNGYIIEPHDMKTFKERILSLYREKDLREILGFYGREKAMRDFNTVKFEQRLKEIFINK